MARFKLLANADLETVTPGELDDALRHHLAGHAEAWAQEMLRGLKPMRLPTLQAAIPAVAQTTFTINDASTLQVQAVSGVTSMIVQAGPASGMLWAVQRIGIAGIGTGDVFTIYRNQATPNNQIDVVAKLSPTIYPGKLGMLLFPGDVYLATGASSLTAGVMVMYGEVIEVPMAMIGKLV